MGLERGVSKELVLTIMEEIVVLDKPLILEVERVVKDSYTWSSSEYSSHNQVSENEQKRYQILHNRGLQLVCFCSGKEKPFEQGKKLESWFLEHFYPASSMEICDTMPDFMEDKFSALGLIKGIFSLDCHGFHVDLAIKRKISANDIDRVGYTLNFSYSCEVDVF
ncbi:hypothetical protein AAES_160588 [Amazona aestiva]|uniref:Uncharacterized protein n=1 Tax=Amazona aestiva TaxID=12930 RepID=A0A0Q3T0Q0_AMAAE|nr:hypothetical protein AAES_160588 [Amazona aestiva]